MRWVAVMTVVSFLKSPVSTNIPMVSTYECMGGTVINRLSSYQLSQQVRLGIYKKLEVFKT